MSLDYTDERPADFGDDRPTRVRWLVLALCCGTSWFLYLHRATFQVIMPELEKEYGWSKETLGALASVFNLTYSAGQVPGGMLCDWFGPHRFVGGSILAWSLGVLLMALATSLPAMYTARLYFGLAQAGCYPGISKVTRMWVPLAVRTTAQGWIASFFGRAGGACSSIILATFLMHHLGFGWRTALFLLTAAGMLFGLLFLVLVRNSPAEHPWANDAEQRLVDAGETVSSAQFTRSVLPWRRALPNRNLQLVLIQQFCAAFPDMLFTTWIFTYLLEAKNFDGRSAGLYASLPLFGGAAGGLFAGMFQDYLIHRTGNRRWSRSFMGAFGNLAATVLMFASLLLNDGRLVMVAFGFVKFFADWAQPTVWGTITDIGGRSAATVFGIVNTVGAFAGFLAPWLMGVTIARFNEQYPGRGWTALFILVGSIYLVGALCWTLIDCTKRVDEE